MNDMDDGLTQLPPVKSKPEKTGALSHSTPPDLGAEPLDFILVILTYFTLALLAKL